MENHNFSSPKYRLKVLKFKFSYKINSCKKRRLWGLNWHRLGHHFLQCSVWYHKNLQICGWLKPERHTLEICGCAICRLFIKKNLGLAISGQTQVRNLRICNCGLSTRIFACPSLQRKLLQIRSPRAILLNFSTQNFKFTYKLVKIDNICNRKLSFSFAKRGGQDIVRIHSAW